MSKSFRIRTTPGEDNGYLKVNLDLTQNHDFLELLSLKISQTDEYQSFCGEYGVVAGRIDINNGFGVPNAKVSIFIPIEDSDRDNPIISSIYPYTTPNPDDKNSQGIRYNLLPNQQQSLDHTPVGTFPEKREILDSNTTLEIYEKYYKYSTTTNEAGDYILFGIPVGQHTLHYDVDLSDIGFLSSRPFELISQGFSEDLFDSRFKFKGSNNLSSLPQIISDNIEVNVEPYWCDSLSIGRQIGIIRKDISINQVELVPTSIFLGSIISDDEKDSVNKNCKPDRDMGRMKEMITNSGKLEAIRRTVDGTIEKFEINGDAIDENGNWSIQLPMNLRKVITNEFGDLVPSPDGVKGVATEGDYRFKVSMDQSDTDKRLRQRAKFLVPNLHNNYHFKTYGYEELKGSNHFPINKQLSTITTNTPYSADTTNQYNYLEDFYSFRWKKVYTVKQYIGRFQKLPLDETRGFIGIKDISNGEGINKFPSNRADTSVHPLYTILCILLTYIGTIVAIINGIIMFINGLITAICNIKIPTSLKITYCFRIAGQGTCNDAYANNDCVDYPSGCGNTNCHKCQCNPTFDSSGCGGDSTTRFGILLGWKCVFSPLLCNNCNSYCDEPHSCCPSCKDYTGPPGTYPGAGSPYPPTCLAGKCKQNDPSYYGSDKGDCVQTAKCNSPSFTDVLDGPPDWTCCRLCCLQVPLIKLKCAEDPTNVFQHTLFKNPFINVDCNRTYLGIDSPTSDNPGSEPILCQNCGGPQIKGIKDWVSCVLEPVAVWLKMLKFDFYNDWVGGTLYFPLIKRKYKLKKRGRKFGQIKKDKFCQFNCRETNFNSLISGIGNYFTSGNVPTLPSSIFTSNFQGNDAGYTVHRIRIEKPTYTDPLITSSGCRFTLQADISSNWFGTQSSTQAEDLELATKEIVLKGRNDADEGCQIQFNNYAALQSFFNGYPSINVLEEDKTEKSIYGEPNYVLTEDKFGQDTWVNMGGYGLQKNICNLTYMIERSEYFKESLDCSPINVLVSGSPADIVPPETTPSEPGAGLLTKPIANGHISYTNTCIKDYDCLPACGSNGVQACNLFCDCYTTIPSIPDYKKIISHGLITWFDQEIFYTPVIPSADTKFNWAEYKANLMLPTTIMELGSMTFCDVDDAPFIMNDLPPTTYGVSYESVKYKTKVDDAAAGIYKITKFKDKEGSINLSAYVEFGCVATVCFNSPATVAGSQIGVDSIDKNDIGIEIGTCFMRFEHDVDVREYFCKRFNGYKNGQLGFHYQRPGSNQFENDYEEYPEMQLLENPQRTYVFTTQGNRRYVSEYNDSDFFTPGDGCGYYTYKADGQPDNTINPDYFYGLAPGHTMTLINFPNGNDTIDFGQTSHPGGVDYIGSGDTYNGSYDAKGIRFNRSQTPYYLYFGLVPGKTALHKTVGKFFADRINAVTLEGVSQSDTQVSETTNNQNNINNTVTNPYSIYKTCLGQTVIPSSTSTGGGITGPSGGSGSSGGGSSSGGSNPQLPSPPVYTTGGGLGNLNPFQSNNPNYTISGWNYIWLQLNHPPNQWVSGQVVVNGVPVTLSLKIFGGSSTLPGSSGRGDFKIQGPNSSTLSTQPDVVAGHVTANPPYSITLLDFQTLATNNVTEEITITINTNGTYYFYLRYTPFGGNQDGYISLT